MKLYAFQVKPNLNTRTALHLLKSSHITRAQFTPPNSPSQSQSKPINLQSRQPSLLDSSNEVQIEKLINSTKTKIPETEETVQNLPDAIPRWFLIGGASLGIAFLVLGLDGHREALALGPEGPLVEEFWDNMRRYALYALTVSTGMAYTVLEPIVALLKNPITAILILIVVVGSGFVVSQVLNAMVGNSDFAYNYAY
ncbi:hypothetical protein LUZ62_042875 [Rhynchospora pubera]|uniref:Uncharacterized protein ycf33 n=1 Tax=Rhynchospora pubera TaxID=906938 RepID=A0AAV8FEC1_9POAL|nr:hypothetical protein LUZ62_042875 [Rhynchospora pubera]